MGFFFESETQGDSFPQAQTTVTMGEAVCDDRMGGGYGYAETRGGLFETATFEAPHLQGDTGLFRQVVKRLHQQAKFVFGDGLGFRRGQIIRNPIHVYHALINDLCLKSVSAPFVDGKVAHDAIKVGGSKIDLPGPRGTADAKPGILNHVFSRGHVPDNIIRDPDEPTPMGGECRQNVPLFRQYAQP